MDNEPATIYKTNAVLRGIVVGKGKHSVVLKYQPTSIIILIAISALGGMGLLGMIIIPLIRYR